LEEARCLVDTFELDDQLTTEALSRAILHDHPVYDLLYVVLAMRFGARFLSADGKLLKPAARVDPSMVWYSDVRAGSGARCTGAGFLRLPSGPASALAVAASPWLWFGPAGRAPQGAPVGHRQGPPPGRSMGKTGKSGWRNAELRGPRQTWPGRREVAERVATALKPAPPLRIVRPVKPCTSVRFRFAPPKEAKT